MNSVVQLHGMKQIAKSISRLPIELQRAAEVAALRGGGKIILKAAKSFAKSSEDTGLLQKSLGVTVRKGRSGKERGIYTARIGPRTGFGKTIGTHKTGKKAGQPIRKDPSKYGHLVELGTIHSEAKPFIRPAVDSAGDSAVAAMAAGYEKGLTRAIAKVKRS